MTEETKQEALEDVRQSLFKTFRDYLPDDDAEAKKLLADHTYIGSEDPGGWAHKAAAVVHCEHIGLPEPCEIPQIELWSDATTNLKTDHFFEHINYAVVSVWPS